MSKPSVKVRERELDVGASLRAVLDCVAQPVWVVDHDGLIRFANPAAIAALGYDELSELQGKPSHETIHHKRRDGSPLPIEDCLLLAPRTTGETVHSEEDWFVRRDGSMFPVSYWSAPLDTPDGCGAVVAFTDIEERRQIEQVLRERNAVLANIEQPVYVGDDEGVIQYANPAAVRALGYDDASELIGKEGHWLVHYKRPDGSHYPIEECPLTNVREIGETLRVDEDWWVRRDGSMIQIAYSAVPIETPNGFGIAITFTDVTEPRRVELERKRAEEALRSSEEHLREILKGAHEAFVSMDATGRIRAWNPEAERTFGWTESEAIGRLLADTIIPTRYREEHRDGLERFLATGQGRLLDRRIEIEAVHRDGHEFPVELTISAIQVGDGYEFNAFLHDISERRAAESAARERDLAEVRAAEARAAQRRIVEAADAARRRLTRDLHDGAQQLLVNALIKFQLAQQKLPSDPKRAHELLDAGVEQATDGMAELRELAAGAYPALLATRGLSAALEALAARAPFPVNLELSFGELPQSTESSVYFFCSEALTNIAKHAQASSGWVCIRRDLDLLSVEVRDDGMGGADRDSDGSGLAGLADRIEALDGTFALTSKAGSGTTVRAEIPLPRRSTN